MSCTVAIPNSPVFSPSRISVASWETLARVHSPSSSPSSASSSPLRLLRHQKPPPSGLVRTSTDFSTSNSTSPTLLKRKRPARLDIPISSMCFATGDCLATPTVVEERREDVIEVEGDGYSVYCKRGRREAMEDRYSAVINPQGDSKQAFFGIFDGHGGAKAAEFAAENLEKNISCELDRRDEDDIEEAVKLGYLNTDSEFLNEGVGGGSCCVTALIRKGKLVVSNVGDCRAVVSRGGIAEALTSDHCPSREDEKRRIETLGGYVDCCHGGVWRIQGTLAVSRSIGDQYLKKWIIAEPETRVLDIKPDFDFLILGSDGLWDKVSNQEAVDIARPLCVGFDKAEPLSACKKLVNLSASRGSTDDTSVMLIHLENFC